MPPERSKKIKEREALAARIRDAGYEMPPCSHCERHGRKCLVLPQDSGRCSECVWRGFKCDVEGIPVSDWSSLEREEKRIRQERKETLAKLLRLDKQEEFLRTRGIAMLRRGLKTLDELDAAEEKERKEKEAKEAAKLQAAQAAEAVMPSFVEGDPEIAFLSDLPVDFWVDLGYGGGTPQASQGT
jgi:hypothetical protein